MQILCYIAEISVLRTSNPNDTNIQTTYQEAYMRGLFVSHHVGVTIIGFIRRLLFVVVVVDLLLFVLSGNFEFHIWLLFLVLTPFTCLLIVCGICKRIKDGRKETRIPLNSNFISGWRCFSEPVEIVMSLWQGVELYCIITSVSYKFEVRYVFGGVSGYV